MPFVWHLGQTHIAFSKGDHVSLFFFTALAASLCYGIGDFVGGKASSKISVVQVLVIGEIFGASIFWGLAWYYGEAALPQDVLLLAIAAGIAGAVGLAALYQGIAQGHTAIVAPLSAALSAIIPAIYGMLTHGLPSTLALVGMGIGIVAITLNSLSGRINGYQGLAQGLFAGVCFGVFLILLKYIGSAGIFAPLATLRSAALLVTIPWLLWRPGSRPTAVGFGLAILAGTFDLGANTAYMLATQLGRIDIASVLASLYPAITVLLALFINGEHITPLQRWGLGATLMATALIAL